MTELLAEHLDGSVRLATLAGECDLSISHFARSFRRTFGSSAHQYLILQRIERAKALLSTSECASPKLHFKRGFLTKLRSAAPSKQLWELPPVNGGEKSVIEIVGSRTLSVRSRLALKDPGNRASTQS